MPPPRLKVSDVNPHVKCTICDGYLVDATAIIECLHAFCRTCIVRYLENSRFCPVCDVQVHKTKPLQSIRSDQTLQDVVYKVVPGLYQNEMQRRRDFYADHPEAGSDEVSNPEDSGRGESRFFSPREAVSLSLQHRPREGKDPTLVKDVATRHLSCPAAFTVAHLKKFVRLKFGLPDSFVVDVFYEDHLLRDSYMLMDVAYIYSWKRAEPMRFFFSVSKRLPRCQAAPTVSSPPTVEKPIELMEVEAPPEEKVTTTTNRLVRSSTEDAVRSPPNVAPKSHHPLHQPTYNSVKVDLHSSPANGFRIKFIHDPELTGRSSKRKEKQSRRHHRTQMTTRPLARLAPYPPPGAPRLSNVVPSVVVTTLVSTRNSIPDEATSCGDSLATSVDEVPTSSDKSESTTNNTKELLRRTADTSSPPASVVTSHVVTTPVCETKVLEDVVSEAETRTTNNSSESDPVSTTDALTAPDPVIPEEKITSTNCEDSNAAAADKTPPSTQKKDAKEEESSKTVVAVESRVNDAGKGKESPTTLRDSISAEFSDDDDDDDLGCRPDLVVDEGGSSRREEEDEDGDLRKKIEAIAAEDDEADSGRASDMSCGPASSSRSTCEEEADSPAAVTTSESANKSTSEESGAVAAVPRQNKSSIDHVIQQLYLRGTASKPTPPPQKEETTGAPLDLSTTPCGGLRKEEQPPRPRVAVANPVLDTKHRQQSYMPAPKQQHTACVPTPRQPVHHLHAPSILQAQLTKQQPPRHPSAPYGRNSSSQLRPGVPPPPSYGYRLSNAHSGIGMFSNMLPYSSIMGMFRSGMVPLRKDAMLHSRMPYVCGPVTPNHRQQSSKDVLRTPATLSKQQQAVCRTLDVSRTSSKQQLQDECRTAAATGRLPDVKSATSPTQQTLRPNRTPPSPASPLPSASPNPSRSASPQLNVQQQCPSKSPLVHKRSGDQHRASFGKFRKTPGAQLAVFNPDPNEYSRLVIKKLDSHPLK